MMTMRQQRQRVETRQGQPADSRQVSTFEIVPLAYPQLRTHWNTRIARA